MFDASLGIDFRKTNLILTLLRRSLSKIRLEGAEIHPLPGEGQKEERETQIISLVNRFVSKHHLSKERVSVSIPREKVVVRFLRFPAATKENLRKVVEYETSKYTPFDKEDVYCDYQILKEEKEWLSLFAVFVRKAEVDACLGLLKRIGIQPVSIQIPSIGALNLFFYHGAGKEGGPFVLLDVTDSFAEMSLIQNRELRESIHLPMPPGQNADKIVNLLRRTGMTEEALSEATFYVYGLGADQPILDGLKESHAVKGAHFPPLNQIERREGNSPLYPIYASVGVPLRGWVKPPVDLNLLPVEMRKKVRQFGKPLFVGLTVLICLFSILWGIGEFKRYRNALAAIDADIKKRRPAVEAVEKLQKQKEGLGKEIAEFAKIKAGEYGKMEILRELTQLLPATVWIWNFKYTGKEVEISGFADSASDLISLIDKSPLFEKVEFSSPVTKERVLIGNEMKERERFKLKAKFETKRASP